MRPGSGKLAAPPQVAADVGAAVHELLSLETAAAQRLTAKSEAGASCHARALDSNAPDGHRCDR
jgi:hypothetical protein